MIILYKQGIFLWVFIVLLVLAAGFFMYVDEVGAYFIDDPIIRTEIYENDHGKTYIIVNEKYRIKCTIDFYIPYQQVADTSFSVWKKNGKLERSHRESSLYKQYFREHFKW